MKKILRSMLWACLLAIHPAAGQPLQPDDRRPLERIEHFKQVRLIEMLDLKEDQSVRFFARLNDHEKTKRGLIQQKMDDLDKIERLVRNHAEAKEFESLFPEVMATNQKIVQEDEKFFNSLTDILSVEQQAKYLLFERQFERELREAMRDIQHRRMRMGQQE